MERNYKSLHTFILLIALFFLPILFAWLLVIQHKEISTGTTNHGELINPPLSLAALNLPHQTELKGKWLLMFLHVPPDCNQVCQHNLSMMQKIRQAMGKDTSRLKLVFISPKIGRKYPYILTLPISKIRIQRFLEQSPNKLNSLQEGALYLVDPLGNVMMEYVLNVEPGGIFKDLEKLLRISQIG